MVDCKDSLRTLTKDSVCTARRIRDTWGRAQSPSLGGGRLGFFHSLKCGDIQGQHRSCGLGEGQSQMDQECTYSSFIQSLSKVPLDRGCGGCWWYLPDPRYPASAYPPTLDTCPEKVAVITRVQLSTQLPLLVDYSLMKGASPGECQPLPSHSQ